MDNLLTQPRAVPTPRTLLSEFAEHKHPYLWLWDPLKGFRSIIVTLIAATSILPDLEFLQRITPVEDLREFWVQKP